MKKNLIILAFFILLALSLNITNYYILFPLSLIGIGILNITVFQILSKWKLWFFLAVLVLLVPLITGNKDAILLGVSYSSDLFRTSLIMVQRSIIILLALKLFTSRISLDKLTEAMERTRFKRFSRVFSISMRVLPDIRTITVDTFHEHRHSRRQRNFFRHTFDYAVKLSVRVLKYAEAFPTEQDKRNLSHD
jgi:energy-coupling factor transporter transmembrane protein EcfT